MTSPTSAQRWSAILLIAGFVGVTYGFGIYVFSQLLPTMSDDLGFSYATAGQITGIGQFLFIVFAFAATWLSHRFNGAVVVVGSAVLCTLCLVGVGLTSSTVVLTLCLAVAAGTSASVYVPIVEIVPRLIGANRRGTALGIISSGTTYGVFVSAAIIPVLTHTVGWRAVWFAVAGVSLVLILIACRLFSRLGLFSDLPDSEGSGVAGRAAADRPRPQRSLAAGIAFLSVWMVGIWIIKFMNGFSFMSFQNFLAPLLRDHGGQSIEYSSAVWMTIAVVGAVAGFAVGRLGDVLGLRRTLTLCYGMFLASCLLLHGAQSGWMPFAAALLFGLSFYPIYGLVPAYVGRVSTVTQATLIFGLANVFQGAGGVVGNLVGGSVANDTAWLPNYYLLLGAGAFVLGAATLALPSDRHSRRAASQPASEAADDSEAVDVGSRSEVGTARATP
ncbi:MAG TPA: MFS transporter [Jatrophihabitans sp.]|jgi:predicted MFS family arabinose efflux permease|uniref:MFS transporter n=1 Tax=Jatrophihabitans sp. TaxID=1932789 RepID=UPI002EFD153A